MGRKARDAWPVVAVAMIVAGTFGLLYVIYRSPHRSDLEAFVAIAVPVAAAAAGLAARAWRMRTVQHGGAVGVAELDERADLLARAVKDQWTRAAGDRGLLEPEPIPVRWRRSVLPFAGPVSAAVGSTRFPPLPGLRAVRQQRLRAGQIRDLHAVYGGLGSGRLVIAGAPGSGKSGAAVLLVLAALSHREQLSEQDRPRVPVPVMFTLHGWDPDRQQVRDWLASRLSQTYPLLSGRGGVVKAAGLLAAGKIAVILDGLDEIPEQLRPVALRALSQQATFRVVVLTRSTEMAAAAERGLLEGAAAVELQDIDPVTASGYLTRVQLDPAPRGWRELADCIRRSPDSPLAHALNSPLTLTLVRDTYRSGDDIGELLDFCGDAERLVSHYDIIDYLLDRVLPAAYAQRPGNPLPRYDLQAAQNVMHHVAARMKQDGARDLQWWSMREWAPAAPRIIMTGIAAGLTAGLTYVLVSLLGAWLKGRVRSGSRARRGRARGRAWGRAGVRARVGARRSYLPAAAGSISSGQPSRVTPRESSMVCTCVRARGRCRGPGPAHVRAADRVQARCLGGAWVGACIRSHGRSHDRGQGHLPRTDSAGPVASIVPPLITWDRARGWARGRARGRAADRDRGRPARDHARDRDPGRDRGRDGGLDRGSLHPARCGQR